MAISRPFSEPHAAHQERLEPHGGRDLAGGQAVAPGGRLADGEAAERRFGLLELGGVLDERADLGCGEACASITTPARRSLSGEKPDAIVSPTNRSA
jgi:hypothetical protein